MGKHAIAVMGLGYGDEGKGSVVDFLTSIARETAVVRYNGGPQAAHHVVRPDGTWHCFSQIGSGAFNGVDTFLYRDMIVEPFALMREHALLSTKTEVPGLYIHPKCVIVTPYHKYVGRAKAIAMGRSTTGMGVGATYDSFSDTVPLKIEDLGYKQTIDSTLQNIQSWAIQTIASYLDRDNLEQLLPLLSDVQKANVHHLRTLYSAFQSRIGEMWWLWSDRELPEMIILEGSQGALLDHDEGTKPHVSPTITRVQDHLLRDLDITTLTKVGITRTYATRHGRGPLEYENELMNRSFPELHNKTNQWQGEFRVGWLNTADLNKAIHICRGIDGIFITCLDSIRKLNVAYIGTPLGKEQVPPREILTSISRMLDQPILGVSTGPTKDEKEWWRAGQKYLEWNNHEKELRQLPHEGVVQSC
jgi:adenylosuccinate synthase